MVKGYSFEIEWTTRFIKKKKRNVKEHVFKDNEILSTPPHFAKNCFHFKASSECTMTLVAIQRYQIPIEIKRNLINFLYNQAANSHPHIVSLKI